MKTKHVYKDRGNANFIRDEFISNNDYIEIFKELVQQEVTPGIKSGVIAYDTTGRLYAIIYSYLESTNTFIIITVIRTNRETPEQIFLDKELPNIVVNYIIPKISDEERYLKKIEKIILQSKENKYLIPPRNKIRTKSKGLK